MTSAVLLANPCAPVVTIAQQVTAAKKTVIQTNFITQQLYLFSGKQLRTKKPHSDKPTSRDLAALPMMSEYDVLWFCGCTPWARCGIRVLNGGRRFMVQPYFPPRNAAARTNSGRAAVEFFANAIRSV